MKMIRKPIILAGLCVALFAAPALASSDLADPGASIPGTAAGVQAGTHAKTAQQKTAHAKPAKRINTVRLDRLHRQHLAEQKSKSTHLASNAQRPIDCTQSRNMANCLSRQRQTAMLRYPGEGPYDLVNAPAGP